ncbi:MAG: SelB C-terminal domain-containing protein, partial [Terriglobales bacterium]
LDPPRQPRAAHAAFATALAAAAVPDAVRLHLRRAGPHGLALANLARSFAMRPADLESGLEAGLPSGIVLCHRPPAAVLAEFAAAHDAELLRSLAPGAASTRLPAHWLAAAAERLLAAGRLIRSAAPPGYALPGAAPGSAQLALRRQVEDLFRHAGLAAAPAAELLRPLPDAAAARAAVTALAREGLILAIHPGHYLHAEAVAALRALLATHAPASPSFSVSDFKQWTGLSRKFVIPLLEYLDRERLTRRRGDRREIVEKAAP